MAIKDNTEMPPAELDVNTARLAHLRWELALEASVNGGDGPAPMRGHEDCELGHWIYGTGLARYGKHNSVWQLKSTHKRFHHLAEETVVALAAGNQGRASEAMASVRRLSGEILYLLTSLELDVIESAMTRANGSDIPSRFMRMIFPRPQPIDMLSVHYHGGQDHPALNVTGVRLAHLKWIRDLQWAFRGHGKTRPVQPSEECSLGIWIHGTALRQLGETESLKALDAAHKRFHREVNLVLSSLAHGLLRKADETYEEALTLSGEIVTRLTRLQLDLSGSDLLSAATSKL